MDVIMDAYDIMDVIMDVIMVYNDVLMGIRDTLFAIITFVIMVYNGVIMETRFADGVCEAVGRRPARGIAARISRLDWGVLKMAPMANGRQVSFKLILSLRKLPPSLGCTVNWNAAEDRWPSAFQCTTY